MRILLTLALLAHVLLIRFAVKPENYLKKLLFLKNQNNTTFNEELKYYLGDLLGLDNTKGLDVRKVSENLSLIKEKIHLRMHRFYSRIKKRYYMQKELAFKDRYPTKHTTFSLNSIVVYILDYIHNLGGVKNADHSA